jgi:hypothetical protein
MKSPIKDERSTTDEESKNAASWRFARPGKTI